MRRQPVKLKGIGKGSKTLHHCRLILCIANAWSIYYILSQRAVPIINCICRTCQNDAVEGVFTPPSAPPTPETERDLSSRVTATSGKYYLREVTKARNKKLLRVEAVRLVYIVRTTTPSIE